jgi:hypothetical protein
MTVVAGARVPAIVITVSGTAVVIAPVRTAATVGVPTAAVISISVVAIAIIAVSIAAIVASSVIAVIPRASAYENAANKVARSVVAIGSAGVRIIAVVPVRTDRGCSISRVVVIRVAVIRIPVIGVAVVSISVVSVAVVVIVVTRGAAISVAIVVVAVIEVAIVGAHADPDRNLRRRSRRGQEQDS